jgi:antitoxin component YwqK of YwqJK toxin-antitoxin module
MVQEVLYFDTGEISYKGPVKEGMPWGWGCRYFKNGSIHLRGIFQGWFIVWGWEYYKNGNLRYVGHYNEGPRHYYGPRYFTKGRIIL